MTWNNQTHSLPVLFSRATLPRTYFRIPVYIYIYMYVCIWVNYNNSLTWIKAIWGWFPLLTMIPVRSQWGRCNLPRMYVYLRWFVPNRHQYMANFRNPAKNIAFGLWPDSTISSKEFSLLNPPITSRFPPLAEMPSLEREIWIGWGICFLGCRRNLETWLGRSLIIQITVWVWTILNQWLAFQAIVVTTDCTIWYGGLSEIKDLLPRYGHWEIGIAFSKPWDVFFGSNVETTG